MSMSYVLDMLGCLLTHRMSAFIAPLVLPDHVRGLCFSVYRATAGSSVTAMRLTQVEQAQEKRLALWSLWTSCMIPARTQTLAFAASCVCVASSAGGI